MKEVLWSGGVRGVSDSPGWGLGSLAHTRVSHRTGLSERSLGREKETSVRSRHMAYLR